MPRERKAIYFELLVVLGLMALPSLFKAVFLFLHPEEGPRPEHASWYFAGKLLSDLLFLGLLLHIVRLNSEGPADFTEPFRGLDLVRGLGLAVGAYVVTTVTTLVLLRLGDPASRSAEPRAVEIFESPMSPFYVLAALVNPFVEETYVRGFLQTRLRQARESAGKIVLFSVLLQTSYHIYQGVTSCLALAPGFAIYAVYYQSSRRLWPVIIAHLLEDVLVLLFYSK